MTEIMNVFVGYDSKEIVAFHTLCHSIIKHSSMSVRFTPIYLQNVKNIFWRSRSSLQSTEFSFSRFLVPYLRDERCSVQVCKHNYVPKDTTKFLGNVQTKYEKKNWSSLMLFNNSRCKRLTTEYVNTASGLELHQFKWLETESEIGELPLVWNWLVGEYSKNADAKMVHFTLGGPYFSDYRNCDYADEWRSAFNEMTSVVEKV